MELVLFWCKKEGPNRPIKGKDLHKPIYEKEKSDPSSSYFQDNAYAMTSYFPFL